VIENKIQNCGRNGISLGSFTLLDNTGKDTGQLLGVLTTVPGSCDTSVTLETGGVPPSATSGNTVVAGGKLANIQIDRNVIHNTGLCGIGPVGFFNLLQALEVISIENLTISANIISTTLQATLAGAAQGASLFGYGAISVPDAENLIIRDNTITDFGVKPGLEVCGIYILHGQMVEISRNHVLETRDWTAVTKAAGAGGFRGGIVALLVTPPSFTSGSAFSKSSTIYEPGLPAFRVEHNVVRVPLGETLAAYGFGPFSIVNNHFACGGTVTATGRPLAQTVLILNLGTAIESLKTASTYTNAYNNINSSATNFQTATQLATSSGAVIFTNNVCQLEAEEIGQRAISSVLILTLDSLNFSSNHCWVDGPRLSAVVDAFLLAG
jgi:hypothetical protein